MVQDTGNRLISAIRKQTEKVAYFCSAENISPNLGVHEIRKSFKRIRGLLKFYFENQDEYHQKLVEEIKALGKQLSPARESFVNIQIFDRLTARSTLIPDKKIKNAKEILSDKNRVLIDEYISKDLCGNIVSFLDKTESAVELLQSNPPAHRQLERQITGSFNDGFEIYLQFETDDTPAKRHELRKVLKGLWYQLDFIKFMHPRYFRMKSNQLTWRRS